MMGVDQNVSGTTILTQRSGCADENPGSSEAKHSKGRPSQRRNWFTEEQSRRRDSNRVGPPSLLCNVTPEEFTGGCGAGAPSGRSRLVITPCLFLKVVGETVPRIIRAKFS